MRKFGHAKRKTRNLAILVQMQPKLLHCHTSSILSINGLVSQNLSDSSCSAFVCHIEYSTLETHPADRHARQF